MNPLYLIYPAGIAILILLSSFFASDYTNVLIPVLAAVMSGILFIYSLYLRNPQTGLPLPIIIPSILLIAALIISALFSVDMQTSIEKSLKFIAGILLFAATYYWLKTKPEQNRKILLNLLLISASITLIIGFIIFIQQFEEIKSYAAIFGQRDVAAGFIILLIPIFMTLGLYEQNKPLAVLYIIAGVLALLALILTGSRGGWIVGGIIIILWIALNLQNIVKKFTLIIFLIIMPFLLGILIDVDKLKRSASTVGSVLTLQDSSLVYRIGLYKQGLQIFKQFPFTGSGLGTFGQLSSTYGTNVRYYAEYAHSLYIQMLAETGIIGFISLIILFGIIIWYGLISIRAYREDEQNRSIITALVLGLAGLMIHMITDLDWEYLPIQLYFWLIAALLLSFTKTTPSPFLAPPRTVQLLYAAGGLYILVSTWVIADIILFYQGDKILKSNTLTIQGQAANLTANLNPIDSAEFFFQQATSIYPLDWKSRQSLSIIYLNKNDNVKALIEAQNLVQLTPYNTLSWSHLAKLAKRTENYDISEHAYLKAIELAPFQYPINYIGLAKLYEQTKQNNKITEIYQLAEKRFLLEDVLSKDFYNPEYKNHILYIYQQLSIYYKTTSNKQGKEKNEKDIERLMSNKQNEFVTPESTVKNFWGWMTNRELNKVKSSFIYDLQNTRQALLQFPIEVKSGEPKNIKVIMENDFTAIVKYNLEYTSQKGEKITSPVFTDILVLQTDGWKIKQLGEEMQ